MNGAEGSMPIPGEMDVAQKQVLYGYLLERMQHLKEQYILPMASEYLGTKTAVTNEEGITIGMPWATWLVNFEGHLRHQLQLGADVSKTITSIEEYLLSLRRDQSDH